MNTSVSIDRAAVNGIRIALASEAVDAAQLRQRACSELLRQAAIRAGLLADDAPNEDGILSEAASVAIEALLERELVIDAPDEAACRRHHASNAAAFRRGERVRVRHVLFAVTTGTDVAALRRQAEATLLEVRCHGDDGIDRFGQAAHDLSNCPSGAQRGDLGWLERSECAPEFAAEVFGRTEVGVLPRLVHTRFGLHVVEVVERDPGEALSFDAVRGSIEAALRSQRYVTELRKYVSRLAAQARIEGVDLDAFSQPLDNG